MAIQSRIDPAITMSSQVGAWVPSAATPGPSRAAVPSSAVSSWLLATSKIGPR